MAEIKDKGKVARVPVFQTPPKAQYQRQNKKERFVQNIFHPDIDIHKIQNFWPPLFFLFFFFFFKKE